jgi:hypothetical protein
MEDHIGGGTERDVWITVDENGQQTLFRLVEAGGAGDVARLISDLQLPVVMIDVVVPPTGWLEATPGTIQARARAILIVLSLQRVNASDTVGLMAYQSRAEERIATFEWQMPHLANGES